MCDKKFKASNFSCDNISCLQKYPYNEEVYDFDEWSPYNKEPEYIESYEDKETILPQNAFSDVWDEVAGANLRHIGL